MRARLILTGLLMAALAHGAASAQAGSSAGSSALLRLRGKFATPALTLTPTPESPTAAPAALRGPLGAPSPAPTPQRLLADDDGAALAAASAPPGPPPLGQSFAGGLPKAFKGGLAALVLPGLPALAPVGDPSPLCRAECAKTRAFCAVTEDLDCASHWAQCVAACSVPASP